MIRWLVLVYALATVVADQGQSKLNCTVPDGATQNTHAADESGFDLELLLEPELGFLESTDGVDESGGTVLESGESWTVGVTTVKVIRMCVPESEGGCPNIDYDDFFQQQRDFYLKSSGGVQDLQFTTILWEDHSYNTEICELGTSNCFGGTTYGQTVQLISASELVGFDRYMFVMENGCRCLGWGGLGQVNGRYSWINGQPSLRTVGHELGHNNGALHANVNQREYDNDLSVMGASSYVSDFTAVGKVSWNWLKASNVVSFGRDTSSCSDEYNPCIETCTKSNPCVVNLYAHDSCMELDSSCVFNSDRTYVIRIDTPGTTSPTIESLWIEYRTALPSAYGNSEKGVQLVWSSTVAGGTRYGPTQYFDYVSTTTSLQDAYLPLNSHYVYDLDNVGAVIKAVSASTSGASTEHFATVEVYFTDEVASEYNYEIQGSLLHEDPNIHCGDTHEPLIVSSSASFSLYHLFSVEQASVQITRHSVECSGSQTLDSRAGIYVYVTYPLALELDDEPEPRNGAILYIPISCGDSVDYTSTAHIKEYQPPGESVTHPKYQDFSQANYVLVYTGAAADDVVVVVSLDESVECFSPCSAVQLQSTGGDISFEGVYEIESPDYVDFPSFAKDDITMTMSEQGLWVINNGDTQVLSQDVDLDLFQPFPHLETTLFPGYSMSCLIYSDDMNYSPTSAPTSSGNITAFENAEPQPTDPMVMLVLMGSLLVIGVLLLLVVPVRLYQIKSSRRNSARKRSEQGIVGIPAVFTDAPEEIPYDLRYSPQEYQTTSYQPYQQPRPIQAPVQYKPTPVQSPPQFLQPTTQQSSFGKYNSTYGAETSTKRNVTQRKYGVQHFQPQISSQTQQAPTLCQLVRDSRSLVLKWSKSPLADSIAHVVTPDTVKIPGYKLAENYSEVVAKGFPPSQVSTMAALLKLFKIASKTQSSVFVEESLHSRFGIYVLDRLCRISRLESERYADCSTLVAVVIVPLSTSLEGVHSLSLHRFLDIGKRHGVSMKL